MKSSDLITAFILDMLEKSDGALELQRNELAQQFKVVPSQINYVLSSRFTPEHGYIIESRRGGGGFIRITRVQHNKNAHIMHVVNAIGDSINAFDARLFLRNMIEYGYLDAKTGRLIHAACDDRTLGVLTPEYRDRVRANILKNTLLSIISE